MSRTRAKGANLLMAVGPLVATARGWKMKSVTLLMVVGPLVATGYALQLAWNHLADWRDVALLGVMYSLIALGVTVGFHRYLTHASFKANRVVKFILVILGAMAFEGRPISWAANHRQHHAFSDQVGDLHSPHLSRNLFLGFLHAHFAWLLGNERADRQRWAPDLLKDRDLVLLDRLTVVFVALSLIVPFLVGGWSGLLWAGFVRIGLTHHVTWSVNSVCHMFGSRPFNTKDRSTNHWLVGLLGFGEGGHNTHHASPRSARHGLYWWHFDLSWAVICALEKLRVAHTVYTLDPVDLARALRVHAMGVKVILHDRMRKVQAAGKVPARARTLQQGDQT